MPVWSAYANRPPTAAQPQRAWVLAWRRRGPGGQPGCRRGFDPNFWCQHASPRSPLNAQSRHPREVPPTSHRSRRRRLVAAARCGPDTSLRTRASHRCVGSAANGGRGAPASKACACRAAGEQRLPKLWPAQRHRRRSRNGAARFVAADNAVASTTPAPTTRLARAAGMAEAHGVPPTRWLVALMLVCLAMLPAAVAINWCLPHADDGSQPCPDPSQCCAVWVSACWATRSMQPSARSRECMVGRGLAGIRCAANKAVVLIKPFGAPQGICGTGTHYCQQGNCARGACEGNSPPPTLSPPPPPPSPPPPSPRPPLPRPPTPNPPSPRPPSPRPPSPNPPPAGVQSRHRCTALVGLPPPSSHARPTVLAQAHAARCSRTWTCLVQTSTEAGQ